MSWFGPTKIPFCSQSNLITDEDLTPYFWHRIIPDDLDQAISYFKQAIKLDPDFSRAHAALAWAYFKSSLKNALRDVVVDYHKWFYPKVRRDREPR